MNIATIEVSGVYASAKAYTHIPAGLVGATVTFDFSDPKWDNLSKTAIFRGNVTRDVIMSDNIVRVPPETVEEPGSRLLIGVYGVDSNKNIVIPTLWTDIGPIRPAADPSGDPSVDPSLPVWAQLAEEIEKLKSEAPDVPGKPGQDGGYYTPSLTQPNDNTLEFRFTPSNQGMPTVDPVQVELPNSGGNSVLCVTVRKDGSGIATVSHTNSEIQEAYGKGMEIICHYSDMDMSQSLQLVNCITGQCTFTAVGVYGGMRVNWKVVIDRNVPTVELTFDNYVDRETFAGFAEDVDERLTEFSEIAEEEFNHFDTIMVKSVNGQTPDENGNVEITIPDSGGSLVVKYDQSTKTVNHSFDEIKQALDREQVVVLEVVQVHLPIYGYGDSYVAFIHDETGLPVEIYTVYSDGTVHVAEEENTGGNVDLTGVVKSVNGVTPDENGNVEITVSGGATVATVEPAYDDIPKIFFGGALQQTKDEKVVPFRYISKTDDFSGYAEIKAQGNSSMSYPKKNQTVKMFADEACETKLKKDFKGWGKQNKHVYKANWIDLTHARNVVSARLWADVVKSRTNYAELPELLRTSPNQGAVDGFPVKVYADGVYQGRYTLNIPKDAWMANMDKDLDTHCILCGENYVSGCFRASANINESDWTDEIHDTVPASIKTRWNQVISFVMNSTDEEFRANLNQYFYVDSLIDYYLFGLASCGLDAFGKNQLYMTYDGQKWIATMYDMDSTWGLYWNGSKFVSSSYRRDEYEDYVNSTGNLLYVRLEQLFYEELQTRWAELKNGALSIENIINRFERFTDIASAELVKEDYASTTGGGKFTGIPSKDTNNIQQIRSFALTRQAWTDEYVANLTASDPEEPDVPDEPDTPVIPTDGLVYSLPEVKTFNGSSDYVDTGVMLFDTDKDFTIVVDFQTDRSGIASGSNGQIVHCCYEENPWPGMSLMYRYSNSINLAGSTLLDSTKTSDRNLVVITKDAANSIIEARTIDKSATISGKYANTLFEQTTLLGCGQGVDKSRFAFWAGTMYRCDIYLRKFTDTEIDEVLNNSSGTDDVTKEIVINNLVALKEVNDDTCDAASGAFNADAQHNSSGFIPVNPGDNIEFSGASAAYFDAVKNYVSGIPYSGNVPKTVTVPDGVAYICFNYSLNVAPYLIILPVKEADIAIGEDIATGENIDLTGYYSEEGFQTSDTYGTLKLTNVSPGMVFSTQNGNTAHFFDKNKDNLKKPTWNWPITVPEAAVYMAVSFPKATELSVIRTA